MAQVQLATRIDSKVKMVIDRVCRVKGLLLSRFIEDAILDKLEEIEDVEDLRHLRRESSRPLSEIMKDLKVHGKI